MPFILDTFLALEGRSSPEETLCRRTVFELISERGATSPRSFLFHRIPHFNAAWAQRSPNLYQEDSHAASRTLVCATGYHAHLGPRFPP